MTEPEVSGSGPTTANPCELRQRQWVISGHKWFTSGANGADFAIVMVVTDLDAPPYTRASMILVPVETPGFELIRNVSVMGHDQGPGHCEIRYTDCRVPEANLLGERGGGFVIAQDRLGPGRIHHCMRAIGTAERAIEMMCDRANSRDSFGGPLAEKQFVQDFIAKSRMEVDQARLLTLYAAWQMDTEGKRRARQAISMIKVVAANVVMDVTDRAIQCTARSGCRTTPPRRDVALHADAARRRRPGRGPQDGDRPPRAEPAAKRTESSDSSEGAASRPRDRHRRLRRTGQGRQLVS
jgi:alkylation response protein AidB-like acyl-CoA dehydrogenase